MKLKFDNTITRVSTLVALLLMLMFCMSSVTVKSGASTDLQTIDATSKAARITPYNSAGTEITSATTDAYVIPIGTVGRQTGTPAANTTIWSWRNTSLFTYKVKRIYLQGTFDGTAAATTAQYFLARFRTATPTGGTALTAVPKRTTYAALTGNIREAIAGVTTTSVTFDTACYMLANQRQVSATNVLDVHLDDAKSAQDAFEIVANDGLCIRLNAAAVAGDCLTGFIEIER